jgi:hypothetical protein
MDFAEATLGFLECLVRSFAGGCLLSFYGKKKQPLPGSGGVATHYLLKFAVSQKYRVTWKDSDGDWEGEDIWDFPNDAAEMEP